MVVAIVDLTKDDVEDVDALVVWLVEDVSVMVAFEAVGVLVACRGVLAVVAVVVLCMSGGTKIHNAAASDKDLAVASRLNFSAHTVAQTFQSEYTHWLEGELSRQLKAAVQLSSA